MDVEAHLRDGRMSTRSDVKLYLNEVEVAHDTYERSCDAYIKSIGTDKEDEMRRKLDEANETCRKEIKRAMGEVDPTESEPMREITICVICEKPLKPNREHVDTCGERCFKKLLKRQRAHLQRNEEAA